MNKILLILFINIFNFSILIAQQQFEKKINPMGEKYEQIEKEYQFLKEEIRNFRDQIALERQAHREFLEDTYSKLAWFIGVVAAVVGGIIIFFDIRTKKDIKDTVQRRFREYTKGLIDEENERINISISDLKKIINRETSYLNKQIVFLGAEKDRQKFQNRELQLINARGIQFIKFAEKAEEINKLIAAEKIDLIIYYYDPTENKNDPVLHQLISILDNNGKKIPLLVYNYEKEGEGGRLFHSDREKVQTYPYHIIPNSPITLINHLYTTINYFST